MSAYFTSLFLLTSVPSAADTVRQGLEAKSELWFHCLVWSSIIVGIGVLLEGPEATIDLKRWYFHWKGKEVGPENPKSWAIPASYLGFVLVVGGVVGEGIFEFLSSNVETLLRAHDEQVLADTILRAGAAKYSADAAAIAAAGAEGSAGNATKIAHVARTEADSFEARIASANEKAASASEKAADAESHLADALRQTAQAEEELKRIRSPRSLINVTELIAALEPLRGTEYTLNVSEDFESTQFVKVVDGILGQAGWIRKQPGTVKLGQPGLNIFSEDAKDAVPVCVATGIQIYVRSKESLQAINSTELQNLPKTIKSAFILRAELASRISPSNEHNVGDNVFVEAPLGEDSLMICVGKKP